MFLCSYWFNLSFEVSKTMTQIKYNFTLVLNIVLTLYVDIKFCAVLLVSYCSTQS